MSNTKKTIKNAKYKMGDRVNYINGNGVKIIGEKKIIGIEPCTYSDVGIGYYVNPTDTPWCSIPEEHLHHI